MKSYADGNIDTGETISPGQRTLSDSKTKDKLEDPLLAMHCEKEQLLLEMIHLKWTKVKKMKESDPNILR